MKKTLSPSASISLLELLKTRFEKNSLRHSGISWPDVEKKLKKNTEKLWSLGEMQATGGEPDVIDYDKKTSKFIFVDCSPESPIGRRSLCYDGKALESRKANKPKNNAVDVATEMGIELLTEEEYHALQKLGEFDIKTSSWVKTPKNVRDLGGALFCDRRYNRVFTFHNGAESYYSSRGFRGRLTV